MQAHEVVKALLVRRDGISVKAARLIQEMAQRIAELEDKSCTCSLPNCAK